MKSLLSKSLLNFLGYTVIMLLCSMPLFFYIMKHYYAEDLDDLIKYRAADFKISQLPTFSISDIEYWNGFNEDSEIIAFDDSLPLDKVVQKPFYNASEGHPVDYRTVYTKVNIDEQPYILVSRIAMIENGDLMHTLAFQYGLFFLILLIAIFGIQQILSRRLWKPFYTSLDKIESFSLEKGVIPSFGKTDTTEFVRLNTNLTKLMQNNIDVYNQQKEFTENASHELQTPLAVFQSQLDLLLQDSTLSESQMQVIQSLYDVSSRLTRLNKNLLLLAKMDNSQFKETENIDFSQLLDKQLSYLKELALNNGISLSIEIISGSLVVKTNRMLLESLVNNLIVNAIRHNIEGGSIFIRVENNTFMVGNTGDKKPLNKDKIFRRFSRVSEEKKGNGLGLSIVNQICKLHGWKIDYEYRDNMHQFSVIFI